jgi:hypothetical protein
MTDQRHAPAEMIGEVASLFSLLGGIAPKHLVVVGGLVPPLLVPEPPTPHLGSADIDLALSIAITKGETSAYYRSIQEVIAPFFEPTEAAFRWRKRDGVAGIPLLVDFLGPEIEATQVEDGTLLAESDIASRNTGPLLRPLPLAAARLVDLDADIFTAEGVDLVYDPGTRAEIDVRHAGPVGFLASKADALGTRSEPKDGYDISWWCLNAKDDPALVAELVMERPAFEDEYFQESVALLHKAFREPDYPGPSGYAKELNPNAEAGDEAFERSRNEAFLVVSQVIEILRANLWRRP